MAKSESIKDIKLQLTEINDLKDNRLFIWRQDERQGVQKLLQQFDRRLQKEADLIAKLHEMSEFENNCYQQGYQLIAGIDEVGRGPLAGPVVAAAVILDPKKTIIGLNDSKQLSEKKRDVLYAQIEEKALAIGIAEISSSEIDQINIYQASKQAMVNAVSQLNIQPDYLLIDAMELPLDLPQEKIIKGDARSISIAAASIVAKVYRDKLMKQYDQEFPGYGFNNNAGYGTKEHLQGLEVFGATSIHRKTFAPVKNYIN